MTFKNDPDGTRLPVKIDSTSNGEFVPVPLAKRNRVANEWALAAADENARRLNMDRRGFLVSGAGAATTLLAINRANAAAGKTGGYFNLAPGAALDNHMADEALGGGEFIFDVQGHFVDPTGAWLDLLPEGARPLSGMPNAQSCTIDRPDTDRDYLYCLGPDAFIQDVFMDSDTDMMVLSFVPSTPEGEPLTIEEAANVRGIIDEMEGTHRLLLHGRVNPNQDGDIARMPELAEEWGISAWKTYTQWGPDGAGYFLSDEDSGIPFIEEARRLGINVICVHKGLPFGRRSYEHSQSHDIGRVAKMYPDMNFIVYHSSFVTGVEEQAFEAGAGRDGVDTLIQSLIDNEVAPNSNVYAELGSTWRFLMRDPDQAAHVFGKLMRYVGEDNILWGTDSIWYGSPQDQIQAFRAFQISEAFQETYGYAPMTAEVKAKIFGLNATKPYRISADEVQKHTSRDPIGRKRAEYREAPDPHFKTFGPKNRRQFMNLLQWNGGERV